MVRSEDPDAPAGRDRTIIQLLRADPQRGFSLLLQQHGGRVRGHLRQRFPTLHEWELQDAVTDAMLALAESFDETRGSLAAWFVLLAHQQAISRWRARPALPTAVGDPREVSDGAEGPLATLVSQERLRELERVIEQLPPLEQAVVEADIAAGRAASARQLASELGTSAASIYAARRRARAKLAAKLEWLNRWLLSQKSEK